MPTSSRPLVPAFTAVLAADVAGGLLDVRAGRSSLRAAWGPQATLCAPWPMILLQAATVGIAVRAPRTPKRVAAGVLATACGASLASGFFDGQLARRDLTRQEVAFQACLLALTAVLGWAAASVVIQDA